MFLGSLFLRFELTVFFYYGDFVFFLQGTWRHYYLKQSVLKKVSIFSDLHNCCSNFIINFLKFLTQVPQVLTFFTLVYYFLSTCISEFFYEPFERMLYVWCICPTYLNVCSLKTKAILLQKSYFIDQNQETNANTMLLPNL